MTHETIKHLACCVLLSTLGGCGSQFFGVLRDNPLCSTRCESKKEFRNVLCECSCLQDLCSQGYSPDEKNDCKCKKDNLPPNTPPQPITAIGSSCACASPSGYVQAHRLDCFDGYQNISKDELVTVVARPKGSGPDSSCVAACGDDREIFGIFRMRVEGAVCSNAAVFKLNVYGRLAGPQSERPFLEIRRAQYAQAVASMFGKAEFSAFATSPLVRSSLGTQLAQASPSPVASGFIIRDNGKQCAAECKEDGPLCTRLRMDEANSRYVRDLVNELPKGGASLTLDAEYIRLRLHGKPGACPRGPVTVKGGALLNEGRECEESLNVDLAGTPDFKVNVAVPKKLAGNANFNGDVRRFTFADPNEMISLRLEPLAAHEIAGGRIRELIVSPKEILAEAQNGCIAISLE